MTSITTVTTVTSPRGFRVRFEFLARAGEKTIIGEPRPEVEAETSRGGFAATSRERAQRVIARCVRMGWDVVTKTAAPSDEAA